MGKVIKAVGNVVGGVVDAVVDVGSAIIEGAADIVVAVVEAAVDVTVFIVESAIDVVVFVWNEVVIPIVEEVLSWLGITDETLVDSQRITTKMFGDEPGDPMKRAKTRALISWLSEDTSFWKIVTREVMANKIQVEGYFRFAQKGNYIHGLPQMTIRGGTVDTDAVKTAIETIAGVPCTLIRNNMKIPADDVYFKHQLQASPHFYKPGTKRLTALNEWGEAYSDWVWQNIEYVPGDDNYLITVYRNAEVAIFWVTVEESVTNGGEFVFTVRSNRNVPAGKTVDILLRYSGSLDSNKYLAPDKVTMVAGTNSVDVTVNIPIDGVISKTIESDSSVPSPRVFNSDSQVVSYLIMSEDEVLSPSFTPTVPNPVGSIPNLTMEVVEVDNSTRAFQEVEISLIGEKTVTLDDDTDLLLYMDSVTVDHLETSVTIPVTLRVPTTGPFTVDYVFSDGEAIGGFDYDDAPGTLSFLGTADEVQNIIIPLTPDVVEGAKETFTVSLENSSDLTINTDSTAVVTLTDGVIIPEELTTKRKEKVLTFPSYIKSRMAVVEYHKTSDPDTNWKYWLYDPEDGTYPTISNQSSLITNLEMLPIVPLRADKVSLTDKKGTDEYRTSRLMGQRLGLSIDEIIEAVEGSKNPEGDSNIGQIDDVYINYALSPKDNNKHVSKMFWLSFYEIIVVNGVTSNTNSYSTTFAQGDIKNGMVWSGHSHVEDKAGTATTTGDYIHEVVNIPESSYQDINDDTVVVPEQDNLVIRYQKSDGFYDEITIVSLSSVSLIAYDGHHTMSASNCGSENFTFPISWYVFSKLDFKEIVDVYEHILRMDMHAIVITELKWYETAGFWNLLKFVGVVMTFISFGSASSIYVVIARMAAQYMVMKLVVFIAEATGNATLAAIVGVVASIVINPSLGLTAIDFTTADGLTKLVTDFSTNLGNASDEILGGLKEDLDDLVAEYEQVKEDYNTEDQQPLMDVSEYVSLKSVDTSIYVSRDAQYDYDTLLGGNYDRLVSDFCDNTLRTGVL